MHWTRGPSSVVAASLRAYRARSRRDAAVERDDVVVAKGRPLGRGSHGVVKRTWRGRPVAVKQVPLDDDEAAVAMQRELKALAGFAAPERRRVARRTDRRRRGPALGDPRIRASRLAAPHAAPVVGERHAGVLRRREGAAGARRSLLGRRGGRLRRACLPAPPQRHPRRRQGGERAAGQRGRSEDLGLWISASGRNGGLHAHAAVARRNGGLHGSRAGRGGRLDRDGASADIFAVAVLLAEVLTGDEPFADARNDVAIALRVRDGERPALPKSAPGRGCARPSCGAGTRIRPHAPTPRIYCWTCWTCASTTRLRRCRMMTASRSCASRRRRAASSCRRCWPSKG